MMLTVQLLPEPVRYFGHSELQIVKYSSSLLRAISHLKETQNKANQDHVLGRMFPILDTR